MKKITLSAISLFCAMSLFTGCSDDSSSDSISKASSKEDEASKELSANFTMLDVFYIYGHTRNEIAKSVDEYVGKGTKENSLGINNDERCSEEYYDVCYMYNKMKDPYTRYYDPISANAIFNMLTSSQEVFIKGIDAVPLITEEKDCYTITDVNDDAKKRGLQVNDIFCTEDIYDAIENNIDNVTIPVYRNKEFVDVTVAIEKANLPTVYLHYETNNKGDSIPVIQITSFAAETSDDSGTYGEFAKALQKTEKYKSLIIDLRKNGGGDTDHCYATTEEFLSKGDTIAINIITDYKEDNEKYYQTLDTIPIVTEKDGSAKDRYIVMLANEGSASCAEIMLSSLAISKKAPIVGKTTYGKQIAQDVFITTEDIRNDKDTPDFFKELRGLSIITTTAMYDKKWNLYHDLGIVPDFDIDDYTEQMKKAVELASEKTSTRVAGYGTEHLGHFAKTAENSNRKESLKNMKLAYKLYKR